MRSDRGGTDWDTRDEINFIDRIGETAPRGRDPEMHKAKMLSGYLDGAELRSDWSSMNRAQIIHHANDQLKRTQYGLLFSKRLGEVMTLDHLIILVAGSIPLCLLLVAIVASLRQKP